MGNPFGLVQFPSQPGFGSSTLRMSQLFFGWLFATYIIDATSVEGTPTMAALIVAAGTVIIMSPRFGGCEPFEWQGTPTAQLPAKIGMTFVANVSGAVPATYVV